MTGCVSTRDAVLALRYTIAANFCSKSRALRAVILCGPVREMNPAQRINELININKVTLTAGIFGMPLPRNQQNPKLGRRIHDGRGHSDTPAKGVELGMWKKVSAWRGIDIGAKSPSCI
jgi:hypothetical protein